LHIQLITVEAVLGSASTSIGYRGWPQALRALAMPLLGTWLQLGGTVSDLAYAEALLKLPEASTPPDCAGRGADVASGHALARLWPFDSAAAPADCGGAAGAARADADLFGGAAGGHGGAPLLATAHAPPLRREEDSQAMFQSEERDLVSFGRQVRAAAQFTCRGCRFCVIAADGRARPDSQQAAACVERCVTVVQQQGLARLHACIRKRSIAVCAHSHIGGGLPFALPPLLTAPGNILNSCHLVRHSTSVQTTY
jgi:hypothetical protein